MLTLQLPGGGQVGEDVLLIVVSEKEIEWMRQGNPARGAIRKPVTIQQQRLLKEETILVTGATDLIGLDKELRFLISAGGRIPREKVEETMKRYAIDTERNKR